MVSGGTVMDERDGIIWSYRLVLDRDPSDAELAQLNAPTDTPKSVCLGLMQTAEFMTQLNRPPQDRALMPRVERTGVLWAFRLLLGRDLGDEAAIQSMMTHHFTLAGLRNVILLSEEFRLHGDPLLYPLLVSSVVREFKPACMRGGAPGSFNDFLGNSTRCSFLPPNYAAFSGAVLNPPGASVNPPMHDVGEWIGTLRAVLEATDRLTVLELGAGWAPWLVSAHTAGRRRGIADIHLVGVEGSLARFEYMRQHFIDNGLDPDAHRLIHGVVGAADGVARFPKLTRPDLDHGAAADYGGAGAAQANAADGTTAPEMEEVRCFSLPTLLADMPPVVDLIHCDVQGAEAEVMGAALPILDKRVRRVVIGTHGRAIEDALLDQFSGIGWRLECEKSCTYKQALAGKIVLYQDGEQVWRNPRL